MPKPEILSVCQVLAVVVRYFDQHRGDVCDALLDTITVEDGTAVEKHVYSNEHPFDKYNWIRE